MPKIVANSRPPTNDTPIMLRAVEYTPEANTNGNIPKLSIASETSLKLLVRITQRWIYFDARSINSNATLLTR